MKSVFDFHSCVFQSFWSSNFVLMRNAIALHQNLPLSQILIQNYDPSHILLNRTANLIKGIQVVNINSNTLEFVTRRQIG